MYPLIGQIVMFGGHFAPRGWFFCNGQSLLIQDYPALFSIIGTTYGGDGRTNFNLPDLRSRVALGTGQGTGLENYSLGQTGGEEVVALTAAQMPEHTHAATINTSPDTTLTDVSTGNYLAHEARRGEDALPIYSSADPTASMAADAVVVANTGNGQAHENRQPFIAMNYIIALKGIYPSKFGI